MAISHDIIEVHVNDIPHLIKRRHPKLTTLLKEIEKEEAKGFPRAVGVGIDDLTQDTIEAKIVHMADAIQCKQYAMNEIKLGNTGYMEEVEEYSTIRVNKLESECKSFRRD